MTVGTNIGEDRADFRFEEIFSDRRTNCGGTYRGSDGLGVLGRLPWRTHFNPVDKISDLLFVEPSVHRHLQGAGLSNSFDQQAILGISRDNCGPPAAAYQKPF